MGRRESTEEMAEITLNTSVITISVSGHNSPFPRKRLSDCMKEKQTEIKENKEIKQPRDVLLSKIYLKWKDTESLRIRGWEKMFQTNVRLSFLLPPQILVRFY